MNPWAPLAAATLGWGASAVLTRAVILDGVDTFTIVPLRMVFAMLTLGAVMLTWGRFGTRNPQAWRRGAVLGVVGMALPMVLMTLALEDLPVSLGGLLIALIPLATIAAAHFTVDDETFRARSLPGLLVALAGCALLVGVGAETLEGVDNLWEGVFFTIAGVIMAGIGGALSRRFALEVPADDLVLPQFSVNTAFLLALTPFMARTDLAEIGGTTWALIAGIGAIGTTLAFASFLVAAGVNPASRLALVGYTVPVVAVALAVVFLDEKITPAIIGGAVLIIAGVIIAERANDYVPTPTPPN